MWTYYIVVGSALSLNRIVIRKPSSMSGLYIYTGKLSGWQNMTTVADVVIILYTLDSNNSNNTRVIYTIRHYIIMVCVGEWGGRRRAIIAFNDRLAHTRPQDANKAMLENNHNASRTRIIETGGRALREERSFPGARDRDSYTRGGGGGDCVMMSKNIIYNSNDTGQNVMMHTLTYTAETRCIFIL